MHHSLLLETQPFLQLVAHRVSKTLLCLQQDSSSIICIIIIIIIQSIILHLIQKEHGRITSVSKYKLHKTNYGLIYMHHVHKHHVLLMKPIYCTWCVAILTLSLQLHLPM